MFRRFVWTIKFTATKLQFIRTVLRNRDMPDVVRSSFGRDQDRGKYIHCTLTPNEIASCIGNCPTKTPIAKNLSGSLKRSEKYQKRRCPIMGPIWSFWTKTKTWQATLKSGGNCGHWRQWRKGHSLTSQGKYLNPMELLFNYLKNYYIRPQFPENGEKSQSAKTECNHQNVHGEAGASYAAALLWTAC